MKNTILGCISLLLLTPLSAQYYYNDLLGSAAIEQLMKSYRVNKVRQMSATGFDQNNVKATDFLEFHEVKDNGTTLKITNRSAADHSVTYHRFNADGKLVSSTDSSSLQKSILSYFYDAGDRIIRLENKSSDAAGENVVNETHLWTYDGDKPKSMLRILSGTDYQKPDTLEIRFLADDDGNTGDEVTYRTRRETGRIYYYYDDQGRLTDIVRFNTKLQKLLPDVMFEYDESDRVIQKITTTNDRTVAYLIWRYLFDANGLKTKEALFDNNRQLLGKIEYTYVYGN